MFFFFYFISFSWYWPEGSKIDKITQNDAFFHIKLNFPIPIFHRNQDKDLFEEALQNLKAQTFILTAQQSLYLNVI